MARENIPVAPPRYVTVERFPTAAQSWAFTEPERVCVEDGISTYCDEPLFGPFYFWAYGFDFGVPTDATITRLTLSVKAGPRAPFTAPRFQPELGTYLDGDDFVGVVVGAFSPTPMSDSLIWYDFGDAIADWGWAITPAILADPVNQFSVAVVVSPVGGAQRKIEFDAVKVTITYDTGYRTPRDGPHKKPTPRDPRPRPHTKPKLPRYE